MDVAIADVVLADVYIGVVKAISGSNVKLACHDGLDREFSISALTPIVKGSEMLDKFFGGILNATNINR